MEQRLTRRVPTDLRIEWTVPRPAKGRLGIVKLTPQRETARVVNVSLTGVAIRAQEVPHLDRRALVPLSCAGHDGEVRIRRIVPADDGECVYAAELVSPSRQLVEALLAGTELAQRHCYEVAWNLAE